MALKGADDRLVKKVMDCLSKRARATLQEEMTYQAFSTRRGAPQAPHNCIAVEVWGPNQVLAAYSDNTLRLFQAQARGGGTPTNRRNVVEKSCRELLCQSIDPFTHTKKKSCFLEAITKDPFSQI